MDYKYQVIKVKKTRKKNSPYKYIADFANMAGSPPIGYGHTRASAIGNLILAHAESFRFEFKDDSD